MRKIVLTLLVLTLILSLAACGGNSATPSNTPSTPSAPSTPGQSTPAQSTPAAPAEQTGPEGQKYGGMIRLTCNDTTQTVGLPWELQMREQTLLWPLGECLMLEAVNGDLLPWLAESWDIDIDKLEITFKLKEGVKFSDGSDFDAEAVYWQGMRAIESHAMNQAVVDFEVRGKYEIAAILGSYVNSTIAHFPSHVFVIVSKENYDKNGEDYARENPIGTGPFLMKEKNLGVSVTYGRSDSYWQPGKPFLDGVEYVQVTDVMTQSAAFMSSGEGSLDVLRTSNGELAAQLSALPNVYTTTSPTGVAVIAPDSITEGSPFSKLEVRQALYHAVDRQLICDARGFGLMNPTYQIIPEGFRGYMNELDYKTYSAYDPAKAKELLAQAGYPDGIKTQLNVPPTFDRDSAVAMQDMLAAVGIVCEMVFPEAGAATEMRISGWDGLLLQNLGILTNTSSIIRLNLDPYYEYLPNSWRPIEEIDPVYTAARATPLLEDGMMHKLFGMYLDNMVVVPVFASNTMSIIKDYMHDTHFGEFAGTTLWLPWDAWRN